MLQRTVKAILDRTPLKSRIAVDVITRPGLVQEIDRVFNPRRWPFRAFAVRVYVN
jgi:hypothetical protein